MPVETQSSLSQLRDSIAPILRFLSGPIRGRFSQPGITNFALAFSEQALAAAADAPASS